MFYGLTSIHFLIAGIFSTVFLTTAKFGYFAKESPSVKLSKEEAKQVIQKSAQVN